MEWDLGVVGFGFLAVMALAFGLAAHLVAGKDTTRWMWAIGAGAFLLFGLVISEVWFGWATEEDLQPNYDGLSFDETLLAVIPSALVVYATRRAIRHRRAAGAGDASTPP
jgi:hypothetical protein